MKVALVVPNNKNCINVDAAPPLGLAYIASFIKQQIQNIEIEILDGGIKPNVADYILKNTFDVVGITATTPQINDAYDLADLIKKAKPNTLLVIGGPHVSALPTEASAHTDYVIIGEGELSFSLLLEHFSCLPPKGIIQGIPIDDLNLLPMPAYDLLDLSMYVKNTFNATVLPHPCLGIMTSRGCPYRCRFCYNNSRVAKVRYLNARRVAEEILFLHNKYDISNFYFEDDEFIINYSRLVELSLIFKELGIDKWIRWGCQARATSLNKKIILLLEDMGCVVVVPGFESYVPRVLKYLKGNSIKTSDIDNTVALFENSKIILGGNLMFGCPTETLEEMKISFQFYLNHPSFALLTINCLCPYPGTEIYDDCLKFGLLPKDINYSSLIPTNNLLDLINVSSVPSKQYVSFIIDMWRIRRVVENVRLGRSPFDMIHRKVWWWLSIRHPLIMWSLYVYSFKRYQKSKVKL